MKIIPKILFILLIMFFTPQLTMAHSYPAKVGEKLGTGIANIATGVAEIPKTMIITSHREGAAYGMSAGFLTGIVHMLGRTLTGVLDVATFMIPTTPIAKSPLIWENFDRETTYTSWKMR